VLQGTVLGPTLFKAQSIITSKYSTKKPSLYIENPSPYNGPVDTEEFVSSIVSDLNNFDEWTKIWRLKFNTGKYKLSTSEETTHNTNTYSQKVQMSDSHYPRQPWKEILRPIAQKTLYSTTTTDK